MSRSDGWERVRTDYGIAMWEVWADGWWKCLHGHDPPEGHSAAAVIERRGWRSCERAGHHGSWLPPWEPISPKTP